MNDIDMGYCKVIFEKPVTVYGKVVIKDNILELTTDKGTSFINLDNIIICTTAEVYESNIKR